MSSNNRAIIAKANEAFARNDVEALLALCTEDFNWTMVGSPPAVGKAAVREWMAKAPPEMPQFTVDTVISEGDYVTCIGDMTMPENGENVPYAYCDVWRLEGDKIAGLKAFVIKTKK
jgi:ketosteroid isomerase-like protein